MTEGRFRWVAYMEYLHFGREAIGYVVGPDRPGPKCYEWGLNDDSEGGYASAKVDAQAALLRAAHKLGYKEKRRRSRWMP